jgi:hypothetical protein
MRLFTLAAIAILGAGIASPEEKSLQNQGKPTKKHRFVHRMFGPFSFLRAGMAAGIGQASGAQPEWGQGLQGYGKRVGSAYAGHIVKVAISSPIAYIRHEELDYTPSGKQGFGPRLKYALISTVYTRKTTTGERTVATGEIAGVTGDAFISRLWQPASGRTVAKGFGSMGIILGADAGYRVLKEFWPHPARQNTAEAEKSNIAPAAAQTTEEINAPPKSLPESDGQPVSPIP